ncbi:MAG: acyl-CoA reductase [Bacteroidetes bacterium]|nr:MAG: acyl-CoA reductase [Bacteroidota bacterium]
MSNQNFNADLITEALSDETGKLIGTFADYEANSFKEDSAGKDDPVGCFKQDNPWFTHGNVLSSLEVLRTGLRAGLKHILPDAIPDNDKTIAFVINPGAPFEGMGEILFAAVHGFRCVVKLPPDSKKAFECLLACFGKVDGRLQKSIILIEGNLPPYDGLIGINAFENKTAAAYLSRKPNLMLSFRGCTVTLTGDESKGRLIHVAEDICRYYGRSFYSLKSLRVPEDYNFNDLFAAMEHFNANSNNHRYFNHYEYHKSIFLINGIQHLDNGFILLTPDLEHTGKTAVVTYSHYKLLLEGKPVSNEDITKPVGGNNSLHQALINGTVKEEDRLFYNSAAISGFLSAI